MGTNTSTKEGLIVVAHGEDELHLVRDAYFAAWAHVHLGKACGSGPAGQLHISCEHSLAEVVVATPEAADDTGHGPCSPDRDIC
ncbi:MAG: hypothetical protein ACRDX8_11785 [Acidimicrobiales bacterium]